MEMQVMAKDTEARKSKNSDLLKMCACIQEIKSTISSLKELKFKDQQNGISLLQIRNNSLLSYLMHLVVLITCKINNLPTKQLITPLIRQRILLEKTRPLEIKLKYQIDKLVKQNANSTSLDTNIKNTNAIDSSSNNDNDIMNSKDESRDRVDLLNYKPSLNDFAIQVKEGNEIYKPPRLQSLEFKESTKTTDNNRKLSQKQLERAKSSRLLADLHQQFDSRPEEIDVEGIGYKVSSSSGTIAENLVKERLDFEEENFVRKSLSRSEKKAAVSSSSISRFRDEFDELGNDFESIKSIIGDSSLDVSSYYSNTLNNKTSMPGKGMTSTDDTLNGNPLKINPSNSNNLNGMIQKSSKKRSMSKGKDEFVKSKKLMKSNSTKRT